MVRVRAAAAPLPAHALRALAELANEFGNGQIELTRRANFQLRGLQAEGIPALQRELVRLGLAEPSLERERRLGIAVSPLSGPELAALGGAIEAELRAAGPELDSLPSKFGVVVEGPDQALASLFGDVRVELAGELVHVGVAGQRSRATWLGDCRVQEAPGAVGQLAHAYAELGENARRDVNAERLRKRVARWLGAPALQPPAANVTRAAWVGPGAALVSSAAETGNYGLGVPFGSAFAETWFALAALAEHFGAGEIRTTPARSVLLAGVRASDRAQLERAADSLGLIRDPGDPLLFVEACPGAPACASALGETRALARELAGSLQGCLGPERSLHVSGCAKGCARSGSASATLVLDQGSCRLGFDLDTALTSLRDAVPLSAARVQLRSWAQRQPR